MANYLLCTVSENGSRIEWAGYSYETKQEAKEERQRLYNSGVYTYHPENDPLIIRKVDKDGNEYY